MRFDIAIKDIPDHVNAFFSKPSLINTETEFRVKDFMRTDHVTLKENAKLSDAIKIFVKNNIDTISIVNDDKAVIGVITNKLVMKKISQGESLSICVRDVMKINPVITTPEENILTLLRIPVASSIPCR